MVDSISKLTHADVFASDDDTGGAKGDWTLEYGSHTGVAMKSLLDTQYLTNMHTDLSYAPELSIAGSINGTENTSVDLSHLISVTDQDANETLTVTLTANRGFQLWTPKPRPALQLPVTIPPRLQSKGRSPRLMTH